MGQFEQYVESYHPPALHRAIQVVAPLVFLVRAVRDPTLENVLWAVWMVVFMLPSGIAPNATRHRTVSWERNYPVLSGALGFLLMASGAFLLLRFFLNRPHSILLAVPAAAALFTYATLRKRRIPIAAK